MYTQPQNARPAGPDSHPQAMYNGALGHPHSGAHGPSLPPFSSIDSMGPPRSQPANVSSMRYNASDSRARPQEGTSAGTKRGAPPSSTVTSADSSEAEEDGGELPASGLVAPWEVLRGLADVAIERAAKVSCCPRERDGSPDVRLTCNFSCSAGERRGERSSESRSDDLARAEATPSGEAEEGVPCPAEIDDVP